VTVHVPVISIEKAVLTDAVERDKTPITTDDAHTFKVDVKPHQIVTVRLIGK
jgi:hypothetical protein